MLTPRNHGNVREVTFNFLLFRRIAEIWRNNMFVIAWRLSDHSLWKSTHFLEKRKTGLFGKLYLFGTIFSLCIETLVCMISVIKL